MHSQTKIDSVIDSYYAEKVTTTKDTNYIDFEVKTWSLRANSTFKTNSFSVFSGDNRLSYRPNNPFSIGFGFAYYPIIIDFGFNIKPKAKDQTQRFDLQADVMWRNSIINFILQRYQGFNVINENGENLGFRDDISNLTLDLGYAYALNGERMSLSAVLSGSQKQKKGTGSVIVGGFFTYYNIQSDSSMVPSIEENNYTPIYGITESLNIGGGINIGYGQVFVLPKNFFIYAAIIPGIGLLYKDIKSPTINYKDNNPLFFQLNVRFAAGYSGSNYYLILNLSDNLSYTVFGNEFKSTINISKFKLVFGYKFNKS